MEISEFSKKFHEKQIGSIEGLNSLLRSSAEFELYTKTSVSGLTRNLRVEGGGTATSEGDKSGNGWNNDTHADGWDISISSWDRTIGGTEFHGTETSTSPLDSTSFYEVKEEMTELLRIYKKASGGEYRHNPGGSVHIHNTVAYEIERRPSEDEDSFEMTYIPVPLAILDTKAIYRVIGSVIARFLPALRYLSMTCPQGPRAAATGNLSYDRLDGDDIFNWANKVLDYGHTMNTDLDLQTMGRDSCFRVHRSDGIMHWENRILDCTASPTLISAWMSLNRAISLFAFDFARNGYNLELTRDQIVASKNNIHRFTLGHERINKPFIKDNYKEMVGLLYKYFKKSGCLGAIEVFDKIIEQSIPEYLREKKHRATLQIRRIGKHVFDS